MDAALDRLVRERSGGRCEYCRLPQALTPVPFEVDHIIARKHGGLDDPANLCFACFYCNSHKGPNIAGVDPASGAIVRLFHPRRDSWTRHFRWDGPTLLGRTRSGRATIRVLQINSPEFVSVRRVLIAEGRFP